MQESLKQEAREALTSFGGLLLNEMISVQERHRKNLEDLLLWGSVTEHIRVRDSGHLRKGSYFEWDGSIWKVLARIPSDDWFDDTVGLVIGRPSSDKEYDIQWRYTPIRIGKTRLSSVSGSTSRGKLRGFLSKHPSPVGAGGRRVGRISRVRRWFGASSVEG